MDTKFCIAVAALALIGQSCSHEAPRSTSSDAQLLAAPAFPIKHSPNGRYLVDQNNMPFPILGRTSWAIASLSLDDAKFYIDDTVSRGYNSIEVFIPVYRTNNGRAYNAPFNANHDIPFVKRLDLQNWTGALTYSDINAEAPDFSTLNETYWHVIDQLLNYAQDKGVLVFLFPAYTGAGVGDGWRGEMAANEIRPPLPSGKSRMFTYGQTLATRYKAQKNIVWMMGGDDASFTGDEGNAELDLLTGLKSVAGQQSTEFSAEWKGNITGVSQTQFGPSMTLNSTYTWVDIPGYSRQAYREQSTMPAFLLEEPYDEEGPDGDRLSDPYATQPVRRFEWWGWLSTIGGYISGNGYVWPFQPAFDGHNNYDDWHLHLNTPNTQDLSRLNAFIQAIAWYKLVPSQLGTPTAMRQLITQDGGTDVETNDSTGVDYVTAAAAPDGTLLVAYIPPGHATGSITVDMTVMTAAPPRGRWFDPTSGLYTTIGTALSTAGPMQFTTPTAPGQPNGSGNNSAGAKDWVLILDAIDSVKPTVPTGVVATAVSSNQVHLSWTPSMDNTGVTGYNVYRCQGAGCTPSTAIGTAGSTSFSDPSVNPATIYGYSVAAFDASNNTSAPSSTATVTTPGHDSMAPSIPSALVATATSSTQISLTWASSSDDVAVTGYNILRCQGAGCTPTTQVGTSATPSFSDSGLAAGTPYGYRVSAFDAVPNTSAPSATATATTNNTITIGETTVFTSDDNGNATLLLAQSATLGQAATIQSLSFYALTPDTPNHPGADGTLLLGIYDNDPSGKPGTLLAQTAELTPDVSTGGWVTANVTTPRLLQPGTYWLAYHPSSNSLHFRNGGAPLAKYIISPYSAGLTTFSGTPTPTSDHWSFYATLTIGSSAVDNPPTTPTSLSASAISPSQINLSWTASSDDHGVTGYQVFRCQGSGCTPSVQVGTSTTTSFADTNLTASTIYVYTVKATDTGTNTSQASTPATATTNAPATSAPTVTTSAPSGVSSSAATLNGAANPNGLATTGWFRYSTTPVTTCDDTFGTRVPLTGGSNLGNLTASSPYTQNVSLVANTTYYVCAIASNALGTRVGSVVQFATPAAGGVTMGVKTVLSSPDYNSSPILFTQSFTATANGNATSLSMYIDGNSGTGQIVLALYDTNAAGTPGTKLAQTVVANTPLNPTQTSQWLTLSIPPVPITSNVRYWLAYEVTGSAVMYRTGSPGVGDQWTAPLYSNDTIMTFSSTMPNPFGAATSHVGDNPWSFYVTVQ